MLKDSRNLLWILPLAALLTLPLWKPFAVDFLSPVRQEMGPPAESPPNSNIPSSSLMTGVRFEQSRNGAKEWLLTADRLNSLESNTDLRLEDVKALFFGTGGEHEKTRISSRKARYNVDNRQITLQGGVVIRDNKGYEIQTNSLEYHAAEKKIRTTASVTIQGSNIEVSGDRLIYDTETGNFSLAGNVVCRIW